MGQMADSSHDPVMLPVVQNKRDSADEGGCLCHHGHGGFRRFICGSQNVVGIFQQVIRGIFIACLF